MEDLTKKRESDGCKFLGKMMNSDNHVRWIEAAIMVVDTVRDGTPWWRNGILVNSELDNDIKMKITEENKLGRLESA
ncbi:unnamed protein product [Dovyalis caffra]|uniref:Uncharacterized protein n=1 Tax=Dovyalis caffra TaxID=77055 RepID=A0AAV1R8S8_9ROSI|nr:unnamed protein product [Dovyalis caffra]